MMDRLVLDLVRLNEVERERRRQHAAHAWSLMDEARSLSKVSLFGRVGRKERTRVLQLGDSLLLRPGATVGKQCARALQWVVVVSGALGMVKDGTIVDVLGPGEHIGLDETLADEQMMVGLVTVAPTRLLVFGTRQARGLLEVAPRLAAEVGYRRQRPRPWWRRGADGFARASAGRA